MHLPTVITPAVILFSSSFAHCVCRIPSPTYCGGTKRRGNSLGRTQCWYYWVTNQTWPTHGLSPRNELR